MGDCDPSPYATKEDVIELTQRLYGLTVIRIRKLNGYDDQNFHILVSEDFDNPNIIKVHELGYVFKIINRDDTVKLADHLGK